ncbi:hypothetical protein PS718_00816 [Pseudomonas fluorescens]|uniref:Delta-60 repeat domain-containing protein n=1 Tax=Pseudomonas fluorescens TaxID=294 RepID=A0A5E7AN18_PSEFL|nr:hypothetical protein [Pseudomonas fluorescens]VVN77121.1 hypothetical protein PS718_00816 [Pseudomonas fluorescens]
MNQKQANNEAGTLDPSFGLDGVVGWPIEGLTGRSPESMLELADGKLLIAEEPSTRGGPAVLTRLNADGTLDEKFGDGGSVEVHFAKGEEFSIPVLASHPARGWILTGQLLRQIGEHSYYGYVVVVRLLEDGTPDPAFGDKGIVYVDTQKLAVPDEQALAAILAKRAQEPKPLQQSSGNAGSASPSSVVTPEGKIALIDHVSHSSYRMRGIVVRLNPNGSLDTSFNGKGFTLIELNGIEHQYNLVEALVVQKDGNVLVAGTFKPLDEDATYGIYVTRYLENGRLDSGFADQGIATIPLTAGSGWSSVEALTVREADGAIAVVGELTRERIGKGWIAVLNSAGSANLVFNGGKTLYSDMLPEGVRWHYCAWQTNSALLVSGSGGGGFVGQDPSILIARYLVDGAPDTSFNKTGWTVYKNPQGSPILRDCVVMKDQRIVVCGPTFSPTGYKGYVVRYHG